MSLSKLFTNHPIKLHTATAQSGGAVNVQGITSLALSTALSTRAFRADGAVYPTFGSLIRGSHGVSFSTVDLKAFLDECGVTGMLIDSGANPGVVAYLQKHAAGGTRVGDATAEHISWTFGDGLMIPRSLELSHQSPAMLAAEVIGISSDGTTAPAAYNEAVALPTLTEAVANMWTLGKVDLNSTELEGVESVSIDFGITAQAFSRDADVYPTYVSILSIQPTIRIVCSHVDFTSTLTEAGLGYSASQVILYARHISEGGTYVADGTATHISFTLGQCRVDPQAIDGDPKRMTLLVTPWKDGATDPLTIDTTAAIA